MSELRATINIVLLIASGVLLAHAVEGAIDVAVEFGAEVGKNRKAKKTTDN